MYKFALLLIVITSLYLYGNNEPTRPSTPQSLPKGKAVVAHSYAGNASKVAASTLRFQCDGRTQCADMSSCAEATYFLQSCPNTAAMDGDSDGIACELEWCD